MVAALICGICIRNGWKKPDVYQGIYNALHWAVEPGLSPCLRIHSSGSRLPHLHDHHETSEHEVYSWFDPGLVQGTDYRNRYWNDTQTHSMW